MLGDSVPVTVVDPGTGHTHEIKDVRSLTQHGYACPICCNVIEACHVAAMLTEIHPIWDPDKTQPPVMDHTGFELIL